MKQHTYHLGLVSVSFRQHTPREILEAMQKVGLRCIEWGSDIHAPCHDYARLSELVALQAQYGIFCCSYGTYFRLGVTPLTELEQYIHAAKQLGTNILRLWCGGANGAKLSAEERTQLLAQCRAAKEIAEKNDVILCMECHRDTFTEMRADALVLMKEMDSPHFRMYWQPFQWQTVEENINNANALSHFVEHIHVFHWRGKQKLPLADAILDWRAYLSQFTQPRTLLLEFMPNGQLQELQAEAMALKKIVGEQL